jgi:exonuclease III
MSQQNHRYWKVLCWNVQGINSEEKWNPIRDTIIDAGYDIFCFQETKRKNFDMQFIKKFSPSGFDTFEFLPSIGASGGLLIGWKSSVFSGHLVFQNEFAITVKFHAKHNGNSWFLTNIYVPCTPKRKRNFLQWFKHYDITDNGN